MRPVSRFNGFPRDDKPMNRFLIRTASHTRLKPGTNEIAVLAGKPRGGASRFTRASRSAGTGPVQFSTSAMLVARGLVVAIGQRREDAEP